MNKFYLTCVRCGRVYDLDDAATKLFLDAQARSRQVLGLPKNKNIFNIINTHMLCCDKPYYVINLPLTTIGENEMRRLLGMKRVDTYPIKSKSLKKGKSKKRRAQ